jgi:glucosamine kinase
MILIADSGSTKSSWCVAGAPEVQFFESEGYNPYFVDSAYIAASLAKALPATLDTEAITAIFFYGAGCSPDKAHVVTDALQCIFYNAQCYIEDDTLAAARALLGSNVGFAAILGTGTNTCIYDGQNITQNIDSLGFILGDEGSGGSMGKKVIGDYIRESMPAELRLAFYKTYNLTADELIDQVYSKPMANRFCAGFSKFLFDHIQTPYAQKVVKDSFNALFLNLVTKYPDYQNYTFNCVGSIGYYFCDVLAYVAAGYGMRLGTIIQSPIRDLVKYHLTLTDQFQSSL